MAHIHDLIDFTVCAYIVFEDSILLVHHKKLNMWLSVGGHIELDEDPEEALFREIEEESGLEKSSLRVLSDKPDAANWQPRVKSLYVPNYLDIHQINDTHRHVGMVYFLTSNTKEINLAEREHHDIGWYTYDRLDQLKPTLHPGILFYITKALELASKN